MVGWMRRVREGLVVLRAFERKSKRLRNEEAVQGLAYVNIETFQPRLAPDWHIGIQVRSFGRRKLVVEFTLFE